MWTQCQRALLWAAACTVLRVAAQEGETPDVVSGQPEAQPLAGVAAEMFQVGARLQDSLKEVVSEMQADIDSQNSANQVLAAQNANISAEIAHLKQDVAAVKKKGKQVSISKKQVMEALKGVQDVTGAMMEKPAPQSAAQDDSSEEGESQPADGTAMLQEGGGDALEGQADDGDGDENDEDPDDFGLSLVEVSVRRSQVTTHLSKGSQDLLADFSKDMAASMQEAQQVEQMANAVSAHPVAPTRQGKVLLHTSAKPSKRLASDSIIDQFLKTEQEGMRQEQQGLVKLVDKYQGELQGAKKRRTALVATQKQLLETRRKLQKQKARLDAQLAKMQETTRQLAQKAAKLGGYLSKVAATSSSSGAAAQ